MTKGQKLAVLFLVAAALVGLLDSSFLYYKYINASPIDCLLFDGCNTVAQSSYSRPFGIPLPTFGLLFYISILAVFFFYFKLRTAFLNNLLFGVGLVGFAFSLYFIYLQGFIIQAFCFYCLVSALVATIIFCATVYLRGSPLPPRENQQLIT